MSMVDEQDIKLECMRLLVGLFVAVVVMAIVGGIIIFGAEKVSDAISPNTDTTCISMNGNPIEPTPELCRVACDTEAGHPHMQAHYDEVCRCCESKHVDYSNAGEYQQRVFVVNPDGSRGEERTCAYFPNATGCDEK